MRVQKKNLRTRILILAAITLVFLLGGIGYSLHLSWVRLCQNTTDQLKREACTTSTLVKSTLVDASKILDIGRIHLEVSLKSGRLDEKQAHEILHSVVGNFSIYNTADAFGLLLFLDANGQLIARSGEYPCAPLDLSERYYYRSLRDDPLRKFSIGQLRRAATTGRMVFHLSMPLHRANGVFAGVVAVQISEMELAGILMEMFNDKGSHILVQDPDGRTLFRFPVPESLPSVDNPANGTLQRLLTGSSVSRGVIRIPGGTAGFPKTVYAAFDRDSIFGFVSWSSVLESELFGVFMRQNQILVLFSLLALVATGLLFIRLYRQARRLEKALEEANLDHLTFIANRRGMEKEIKRLWRDSSRTGRQISVLFIDIDHFKKFNDLHGHDIGDRVLKAVARSIHESIDRPLDFCCRWGGEEFVIILPETTLAESLTVAKRINHRIANMNIKANGHVMPGITISIGIASSAQGNVGTADELIQRADHAMLQAKEEGRNRIVISQER